MNNVLQTFIISAIIFYIILHTYGQRMLKLCIRTMVPFPKLWTIKQVCAVSHKINPNLTIIFSKVGDLNEKVQSFYQYKNNMKMMCQYSLGDWLPQEADSKTVYCADCLIEPAIRISGWEGGIALGRGRHWSQCSLYKDLSQP